jgi:hypothetical protein
MVILLITLFLFASCQEQQPTAPVLRVSAPSMQPDEPEETSDAGEAYPVAPTLDSAYPGAVSSTVSPSERIILDSGFDPDMPVPTPSATLATVTGHVVSRDSHAPIINIPVVLAQVIRNEQQGAFVYDTATSPFALTDDNGRFIIADVEPAEFIVVVGNIEVNRYEIVTDPSGQTLLIDLAPAQLLDLTDLEVQLEW